jgi:hypothetical protein
MRKFLVKRGNLRHKTVRIWNVAIGKCDRILIAKRLYGGMKLTGVKGLTQATIATLQTLGAIVI